MNFNSPSSDATLSKLNADIFLVVFTFSIITFFIAQNIVNFAGNFILEMGP